MTPTRRRQVLFVQGGGEGAHDDWDAALVASLRRELGAGYEVRYPRMPDEGDPSYAGWGPAVRDALVALDVGAVVVGHSVGGTILAHVLGEQPSTRGLSTIMLIAAPFVGAGGWPGEEFELPVNLGARLPSGVPVHVVHGLADDAVPPSHADLYARVVPQARVHLLAGRDHQLNDDLGKPARLILGEGATV